MANQLTAGEELSYVFARMSGVLLSEETVEPALHLVTSLAADTIPGTTGAGVTLMGADGRPSSAAATDHLVEQADALQHALEEGPCLAAWRDRSVVRVDDLATDERWPHWATAARGLGLGSVLSAPLVTGDVCLGAVKVYAGARTPSAIGTSGPSRSSVPRPPSSSRTSRGTTGPGGSATSCGRRFADGI